MAAEIVSTLAGKSSNRRNLLGHVGRVLALSAVPATSVLASTDPVSVHENPELLALNQARIRARRQLDLADLRVQEAIEFGKEHWPRAPEILDARTDGSRREKSVSKCYVAAWLQNNGPKPPRRVRARKGETAAEREARQVELWKSFDNSLAIWRKQCEAARTYEAERKRVCQMSGYAEASSAYQGALDYFCHICAAIAKQEATTLQGLAIKAAAIASWKSTNHGSRFTDEQNLWILSLLANTLRVEGRDETSIAGATETYLRAVQEQTATDV